MDYVIEHLKECLQYEYEKLKHNEYLLEISKNAFNQQQEYVNEIKKNIEELQKSVERLTNE